MIREVLNQTIDKDFLRRASIPAVHGAIAGGLISFGIDSLEQGDYLLAAISQTMHYPLLVLGRYHYSLVNVVQFFSKDIKRMQSENRRYLREEDAYH